MANEAFSVLYGTNNANFKVENLLHAIAKHNSLQDGAKLHYHDMFDGLFSCNQSKIIDICGLSGSNRSLICLQTCLNLISCGKYVLYVDTRNVITPDRIKCCYEFNKLEYKVSQKYVLDHFYYKYIFDDQEFAEFFSENQLKEMLRQYRNIQLIVVDDIGSPMRKLDSGNRAIKVQKFLNSIHAILQTHRIQILITSNLSMNIVETVLVPSMSDSYSHRVHHRFLFDEGAKQFILFK